ncbi:MAG TPA: amylosucrase [Roseiflexaceae bacterium]|nr:amylosucrase [Roseiflexaceae bacterium]
MHNILQMTPTARAAFEAQIRRIGPRLQAECTGRDADLFLLRIERYFEDLYNPLRTLYGERVDFGGQLDALVDLLLAAYVQRPEQLRRLDIERQITPDWFQRPSMLGYVCYSDLFAGDLRGVCEKLPYLRELGVTYLHLMPLLKPREGPNDGGYAVLDYRTVNPQLGTIDDLQLLSDQLHSSGMSLCVDLVLNHTAKEHAWAQKAMAGDPAYLDYYFAFEDRTLADAYERTLREVFPDFAPGNFSWYPAMAGTGRWVWTTFNEYQWDLNYTNPAVFREMLDIMLYLANKGVDILRLDAVPFMWKRMGTDCENQPEVHLLLQAFRAGVRVVAPAMIFKAEAIVPPQYLVPYLGVGLATGKECELAYNNTLMVQLWSALASRDVRLMTYVLHRLPPTPPGSTWITYIRNHDDIGWAVTDEDAAALGFSGFLHRQFLNQFYSGAFLGSFARGALFQFNPETLDARISGSAASLAGLALAEQEQNGEGALLAIQRVLLLHSVVMAYGGIPLIYMGDELGLLNDSTYLDDPARAEDNRWMHRPPMDWNKAAGRHDPSTHMAAHIYSGLRRLIEARRGARAFHGGGTTQPLWTDNSAVFAFSKSYYGSLVMVLANFSEHPQSVSAGLLTSAGLPGAPRNLLDRPPALATGRLWLEPYEAVWLTSEETA